MLMTNAHAPGAVAGQAQREMELYDRLLSGGTLAPTFDPEQDAEQVRCCCGLPRPG